MNKQKKTVFGGLGVTLLLVALMALMPLSNFVSNDEANVEFVETNTTEVEDIFALPEKIAEADYEYDLSSELLGMRDQTTKAFVTPEGDIAMEIATGPIHYQTADGSWDNIDLNIQANAYGWSVDKNTFTTNFAPEAANGVMIQPNQWVDPVVTGLNPTLVTLDEAGVAPMPFFTQPSQSAISVGGNVIRYPLSEGFDLDYMVDSTQVKQNLIIREAPRLDDSAKWFGLNEGIRMPVGYGLFSGETQLGEELFTTQQGLDIRHIETGELLVSIPVPTVLEADSTEPYFATYMVQVYGPDIVLSTVVSTEWLLDDERQFPIALDPTMTVYDSAGGYCYVYYGYCYSNTFRYLYKYSSSYYYLPWAKVTFTSNHVLPTGATVNSITWNEHISYSSYLSSSSTVQVKVLQSCGTDTRYNYAITSNTCSSSAIPVSYLTQNYGGTAALSVISSIGNSPAVANQGYGYSGWTTGSICSTSTACNSTSGGVGYINAAMSNAGTSSGAIGLGIWPASSSGSAHTYAYRYGYSTGTTLYKMTIVYSGGIDNTVPSFDFVPYESDTYIEGERTFFIELSDISGIDTTSSGGPQLVYSVDGGSSWTTTSYGLGSNGVFDADEVTTVGTCASGSTDCKFKARTAALEAGDEVQYYWKFRDLNTGSGGANIGYAPALTGTQTTAPTPYEFEVLDSDTAPDTDKKLTVLTTDVSAYSYSSPYAWFDR